MTQIAHILAHLRSGKAITPPEALNEYGCFRLGARIWELRQDGFRINREIVTDETTGKRYASYRLTA